MASTVEFGGAGISGEIDPGGQISVTWTTATTYDSMNVYATTAIGEELAASWVLADGMTDDAITAGIQDGFVGHGVGVVDTSAYVSLVRCAGWDSGAAPLANQPIADINTYAYRTGITGADEEIRFNHASIPASITTCWLGKSDQSSTSHETEIENLVIGEWIRFTKTDDEYIEVQLTGTPTDNGTFYIITVGSGRASSGFTFPPDDTNGNVKFFPEIFGPGESRLDVRVEIVDDGTPETHRYSWGVSYVLPVLRNGAHTATGLGRLLEQFKGSVRFRALLSSYVDGVQDFEDVAYQIINARRLDIAAGYQLDGLGQIVNVPRGGRDDEDYRLRIRAELAIILSQGTTEDLIGVLRLLLGLASPPDIQIDEYYPKAIFMRPRNFIVNDDPATIAALLRRAASAATNLQFVYSQTESDDDDLFRFSDTNGTSETSSSHGYSNGTYTGAK